MIFDKICQISEVSLCCNLTRAPKRAKGDNMENILIGIHGQGEERFYAFSQSETGTLDFSGKVENPEISEYLEIEGSQYFSPTRYEYLPLELQADIRVLYRETVCMEDANLYAYLTHIGAILLAVEQNDGFLVADLLNRRAKVFSRFLPLTLYIVRPVAPLALFAWLHGRFSNSEGFEHMYHSGLRYPKDGDTAQILFAAAYKALSPDPGKESPEEMFVRYFRTLGHGDFTIGTVGANHHAWDPDTDLLQNTLNDAIGKDILEGTSLVRHRKAQFYASIKVSVQAEPYNPYDPNAIGVSIESVRGRLIGNGGKTKAGYIRATGAEILRKAFPKKYSYAAKLARMVLSVGNSAEDGIVTRISF